MAENFNELDNPADKAMADLKGLIRAEMAKRKSDPRKIAAELNKSLETIYSVMYRDNVRHTWQTIFDLCSYLDIRMALIAGLKSKRQPNELLRLTPKEARWVEAALKDFRPKKRRKRT